MLFEMCPGVCIYIYTFISIGALRAPIEMNDKAVMHQCVITDRFYLKFHKLIIIINLIFRDGATRLLAFWALTCPECKLEKFETSFQISALLFCKTKVSTKKF